MTRVAWLASNSAPAGTPIRITAGAFAFPGGGSIYIPSRTLHAGWGREVSVHIVGPETKPLPDRMEITFFSFLEDKFYQGSFALPHEQIVKLFADGYRSFEEDSGRDTFRTMVAGVAPGGAVAVWVSGVERQVEVFFGQAQAVDLNWHAAMGVSASADRRRFVAGSLAEAAESDSLVTPMTERIPFGLWAAYRHEYRWRPAFDGIAAPSRIDRLSFFNGERDYMVLPLDAAAERTPRPVPSLISFTDTRAGRSYRLIFDEQETLATFARLGAGDQPLELVFAATVRDGRSEFEVLVRSATETVALRKLKRETYRTG
jgi:hypothetical protein